MFQIDQRVDYARVQQFAAQIAEVSPETLREFQAHFHGQENADFHHGLLAGFAGAFVMASSEDLAPDQKQDYLGALVAFVADKIAKQGF